MTVFTGPRLLPLALRCSFRCCRRSYLSSLTPRVNAGSKSHSRETPNWPLRCYSTAVSTASQSQSLASLEAELRFLEEMAVENSISESPSAIHDRDYRFEEILRSAVQKVLPNGTVESSSFPWRVYCMFRQYGKPNVWAYRLMLVYCLDAGDMKKFDQVRSDMALDQVRPDVSVINVLLSRCLLLKQPLQPVLDEAVSAGVSPNRDTFLLRLQAYAERGLVHNCIEVLEEMVQRMLPLEPDDDVFRLIAVAARNSKDTVESVRTAVLAARKLGYTNISWSKLGLPKLC